MLGTFFKRLVLGKILTLDREPEGVAMLSRAESPSIVFTASSLPKPDGPTGDATFILLAILDIFCDLCPTHCATGGDDDLVGAGLFRLLLGPTGIWALVGAAGAAVRSHTSAECGREA